MLRERRRLAYGLLALLLLGATVVSPSVRRGLENAWIGWPIAEGFNRYRPWAYRTRDAECVGALARTGLRFALLPEDRFPADCPAVLPVAIEWPLSERRYMNCGLALALYGYWEGSLRPLARRMLGRELVGIGDLGVRSCRPMSGHRFLLSEHALSNAIDLASFHLDDGDVIDVERSWTGGGLEAAFLREAARAACDHFSMVISPDHDETHRDHLHLDLGLDAACHVGQPADPAGGQLQRERRSRR
jgi:hypothetical protein